ncbi:MAG: hypothetical protein SFV81_27345 [Pirellulaceae bacterium]|nr:hypothetical protein [Pirellulaceae bacterium]
MSQEPPRVIFHGTDAPQGNSAGQSTGRRPSSGPGRIVAILLGSLFLLVFLCGGGLFLTVRRMNSDSNFGGSFRELREPIGGTIPEKTRLATQRAIASQSDEAEEVANWLRNGFPEIDKPRMVMEMQRSGLSKAAVNFLTRSVFALSLDEAFEPPNLGDRVVVLDFEWIVKDKEARAVVASFASYAEESSVYVLYLNRQNDQWMLFDWRDVLLPMSEAQYWAIYAGMSEPEDQVYLDFRDTAYEIYCSDSTNADKIKHTMEKYKATTFPTRYSTMAQDTLCTWLVTYNAKAELAEISDQLTANDFAGAWLYKARSAAWSNKVELAFEHLDALNRQVGWHPEAGRMAAQIAETPEQKRTASKWLEREVLIAPVNSDVLNNYFKLADQQQVSALFQAFANSSAPDTAAFELLKSMDFLTEPKILYLKEAVAPIEKLEGAERYLDFKLAVLKEDSASVLELAPKVLQLAQLSDPASSISQEGLWRSYVKAAADTNALKRAFEETPDRDRFLYQLRELASTNESSVPPQDTLDLLGSIPQDSTLHDDLQVKIAMAKMQIQLGKASEAFDFLLAVYKECQSELPEGEPIEFAYPVLSTLGKAAFKSQRWRELNEVLEPEEMLLLAGLESTSSDQLNQVLEWYEGLENQPAYWAQYFRARAAFASGDWPTADRLLVEATRLAAQDERVNDHFLPAIVVLLLNYLEADGFDAYESNLAMHWSQLRMTYAIRCDALDRLVAAAQVADELDDNLVTRVASCYPLASLEAQEKLAAILRASPLAKAQSLSGDIRSRLLAARGQFAEAVDDQVKRASELEVGSYQQRLALLAAGTQLLKSGDRGRIESLKQVSRGTDVEAYIDCVAATLDQDLPTLSAAIKRWEEAEWSYRKYLDINALKRLQGLPNLDELFDSHSLELKLFRDSGDVSLIVLDADPAIAAKEFETFVRSQGLNCNVLEAARFDQAAAALEVQTSDCELVFTFTPTNAQAFVESTLTSTFANNARTIVRCTPKDTGLGQYAAKHVAVRTQLNSLLGGLSSAVAVYDSGAKSVFCGTDWQQRFSQSVHTGIDPAHPQECLGILAPKSEPEFLERDGRSYVAVGEARELIPVKLEAHASPWLQKRCHTLSPSILAPCLPVGAAVKVER